MVEGVLKMELIPTAIVFLAVFLAIGIIYSIYIYFHYKNELRKMKRNMRKMEKNLMWALEKVEWGELNARTKK